MSNCFEKAAFCFAATASLWLSGCSSPGEVKTLRSLDVAQGYLGSDEVFVKPKTEEEVKQAYYEYISSGSSGESSRLVAINRLAEMEIDRLNQLLKSEESLGLDDELYRESLRRTLDLLQTSLEEFPDAPSNDEILYQLARTHEQLGDPESSLQALQELTRRYPESGHYAEAQFRLGEAAFAAGDYIGAEDAYSEALVSDQSKSFYERSLFKRGWSRYKQGLYIHAADDYLAALKLRDFNEYEQLEGKEKGEVDESFRALGLAFANLQDLTVLQNFFAAGSDLKYLYHIYRVISETYLEQERYSDAAGVLGHFVTFNGDSPSVPLARLKIMETWRAGGFRTLFNEALESFYQDYHPARAYWQAPANDANRTTVFEALRTYALQLATYQHDQYLSSRNPEALKAATDWYSRYLEHFAAYARQDKVYKSYAELLSGEGNDEAALHYFELAAYDGDIILDKEAAYATVVLSDKLFQESGKATPWLDKHLHYALISARLYPNEPRYHAVALHAAESAFNNKRFEQAVELVDALPDISGDDLLYPAGVLKGLAYRDMGKPAAAEAVFTDLLTRELGRAEKAKQRDNLALAIYQQAELELAANNTEPAIQHFARVARHTPDSPIAPKALYEAIVLSMKHEYWTRAIGYAEHFQAHYGDHELSRDATRQVSAAYLKAGDKGKAARAFEQLAAQDQDREVKMAALWQAAQLYESRNELESAIRSYRSYAHSYPRPYPQNVEAMYKLTELYELANDAEKKLFWQNKIAEADQQAAKSDKTERTNQLAASTLLDLARQKAAEFSQRKLVAPLAQNLRIKKQLMQESIGLFGRSSVYSIPDITTEATFSIGRIYQEFSKALLNSERPAELKGEELAQYNILIEDQAFPFEEKAIEFYEMNLARVREGVSNRWVLESYRQLAPLFPARYNRKGKVDTYR